MKSTNVNKVYIVGSLNHPACRRISYVCDLFRIKSTLIIPRSVHKLSITNLAGISSSSKGMPSEIFVKNGELVLDGKLKINVINYDEVYKYLLTPKNYRNKIKKIDLNFTYNFDQKIAELKDIKIDNKINQSVNKILNNVVFKKEDLQNKIYFKNLLNEHKCELIGSGYSQLIGPLVPYNVNFWNQKLGLETYLDILETKPDIVLVNEMAFSSSMVDIYNEFNFKGMIMDRDNVRLAIGPKKLPTKAQGLKNNSIQILWSDSILFQKIQILLK